LWTKKKEAKKKNFLRRNSVSPPVRQKARPSLVEERAFLLQNLYFLEQKISMEKIF